MPTRAKWISSFMVLAAAASLSGCLPRTQAGAGGNTSAAAGFSARCNADYGATQAAQKIESFFQATAEFSQAALEVEGELIAACQRMGRELQIPDGELSGQGPQGLRAVCGAVDAKMREEIRAITAATEIRAQVEATPPHCEVSIDAYANCAAECEANIDPGSVQIECHGGEIRGRCAAECNGSCALEVQGQCNGVCEGSCDGTCSASGYEGACQGRCDGTCRGECVAEVRGGCQGECRGGCSVEFQEPYCTGDVRPPSVSARCRASCDARVAARARCTPGSARLSIAGNVDATVEPRIARVRAAIEAGLGSVYTLRARIERLHHSGAEIVRIGPQLPGAAATVGINAVACATAAAASLAEAFASVSVSVEVSVQVSGSASFEAG